MGLFARLANRYKGAPATKQPQAQDVRVASLGSVLPVLRLSSQFTRIGGGLTPRQVTSIIREADTGYISRLVDLLNESRQKDCHLQSLLGTREAALTGLRWILVPRSRDRQDFDDAQFIESMLKIATGRGRESRSFTDMISHLTGATYFGFANSEMEWIVDQFEGRTILRPLGFMNHSPRRFRFSQLDGTLGWWDSDSPISAEPIDLQAAFPNKFIQHQPRINGDVPTREGLGRVLLWSALFRNWAMSDWLRLAELAWKPWRMAKYKPDASTEEIDDLITALEQLTTNGVGVFSDRTDIVVEWPERGRGGKPEHEVMRDHLGQEMSKAVLGQTLTIEPGERGARSLGDVHDRVRKDIRELDAISTSVTINRDVVGPIHRLNGGADRPPPTFLFITDDTVDVGAFARAVDALVRAGVKIKQEWVRDKIGSPEPEEGDEIALGRTFLEAENGLISNNVQEFQGQTFGDDPEDEDEDDDDDGEADDSDDGNSGGSASDDD